jgi:hypothetical protein
MYVLPLPAQSLIPPTLLPFDGEGKHSAVIAVLCLPAHAHWPWLSVFIFLMCNCSLSVVELCCLISALSHLALAVSYLHFVMLTIGCARVQYLFNAIALILCQDRSTCCV